MKLWKKRWFVLSDLCLFYYRGEPRPGRLSGPPLTRVCSGALCSPLNACGFYSLCMKEWLVLQVQACDGFYLVTVLGLSLSIISVIV